MANTKRLFILFVLFLFVFKFFLNSQSLSKINKPFNKFHIHGAWKHPDNTESYSPSGTTLPKFEWANAMGGKLNDFPKGVTVDASGNVYTTGYFYGTADFDPGPGTFNLTSKGSSESFISKLDAKGNFIWAKKLGLGEGISIAVDVAGNIYTTGSFSGTADFDPGDGVFNLIAFGSKSIFISKLTSAGNFEWAKCIGGIGSSSGNSIKLDAVGNVFVSGYYSRRVDFDPGIDSFFLKSAGDYGDVFVSKFDSKGNFNWVKSMGGKDEDIAYDMQLDATGNIYIAGTFHGSGDFDPGSAVTTLTSAGDEDIFITKLNEKGILLWSKRIGGTSSERALSLAVDKKGSVFVTGYFAGTVDFDPGENTFNLTGSQNGEAFILKLTNVGNLAWAKNYSSTQYCIGNSIATGVSGDIYLTGVFAKTTDFDPGKEIFNVTSAGGKDIFISKLDASGKFVWATSIGAAGRDEGASINVDKAGNIYATGFFSETVDFDPGTGKSNLTSGGQLDFFVLKLGK